MKFDLRVQRKPTSADKSFSDEIWTRGPILTIDIAFYAGIWPLFEPKDADQPKLIKGTWNAKSYESGSMKFEPVDRSLAIYMALCSGARSFAEPQSANRQIRF